jgi:hypothetical protein
LEVLPLGKRTTARRLGESMGEDEDIRVLIALSRGDAVPREKVVTAGRMAAESLRRSWGETIISGDGVWNLSRLTETEAAALAVRLSTTLRALQLA